MNKYAFVSLAIILAACSAKSTAYEHAGLFTIEYPTGWTVEDETSELPRNAEVAFISPVIDGTVSNIIVSASNVNPEWEIEDLVSAAKEELTIYPALEEVDSSKTRVSDQKTMMNTYHVKAGEETMGIILQTYVLDEGTAYTITASLPNAASEESVKLVEEAMRSFTLFEEPEATEE